MAAFGADGRCLMRVLREQLDDPAAEDDAAPDAGAEVDHDEVALAASGTEAVLGPRGGVGVVVDEGRERDALGERLAERLVAPREVRGGHDGGPIGRGEARGREVRRAAAGAAGVVAVGSAR